jgi:DNA-binding response OmpR family regulator
MKKENPLVLVIEDEEFISGLIAASLKDEGYSVIVASDYNNALKILDTGSVALVISDVMLPFTGGIELVEYIREHKKIKDTPVVLVTGIDADVLQASKVQANIILPKPFDMLDLVDEVNKLMGRFED